MRISDWSSDVCSSDLLKLRKITGLVDSQHAKAPEVPTALDALGISLLDDKGLDGRRHDPMTEALYRGVHQNDLFRFWGKEGVYGRIAQLHLRHGHPLLATPPRKSQRSTMGPLR